MHFLQVLWYKIELILRNFAKKSSWGHRTTVGAIELLSGLCNHCQSETPGWTPDIRVFFLLFAICFFSYGQFLAAGSGKYNMTSGFFLSEIFFPPSQIRCAAGYRIRLA